ncbi:MAG: hypothetical protein CVT67_04080 [Actinobacteria bacterium HGW-Actinobacteria-7]|nr:MAG: hypothetical protein CVT67_04080 [Actinobacteria bacterium HGW-Actinobacteria-7]
MRSVTFAREELSRLFSRRTLRLALVVILLIPLLYGALYLWAFWDPYKRLSSVPVALVNLDRPARAGDTTVTAGQDLTDELLDRATFGWDVVSPSVAARGVQKGTYYFALTIPADFSKDLASADSARPTRAKLVVAVHESKSMLAAQIGSKAFSEVRFAAAKSASKSYFDNVFIGFEDAREGLADAASGAEDLASGLNDASAGAEKLSAGAFDARSAGQELSAGLGKLASGAKDLAKGTGSLSSGTHKLAVGASSLAGGTRSLAGGADAVSAGARALSGGLEELVSGSGRLADSSSVLADAAYKVDVGVAAAKSRIAEAADGAAQVRDGVQGVEELLSAYAASHPEAAGDPTFAKAAATARATAAGSDSLAVGLSSAKDDAATLATGAHQVAAGASQLLEGAGQLAAGVGAASAGAGRLSEGAASVSAGSKELVSGTAVLSGGTRDALTGAKKLASGSRRLARGVGDASVGSKALVGGLSRLDDGVVTLAEGLCPAAAGSRELANGLTAGAEELPAYSISQRATHAAMMSDPVALETDRIDPVPNYGTGFAPYFIPLALWVGGLMVYFVVNPLPERAVRSGASAPIVALSGLWPGGLLASAQAAIMYVVLRGALGLQPVDPVLFFAFVVLTAVVFSAILQWLSISFGAAGKVLAIVALMLQLTSAAGTFPFETLPEFFQVINPWLPMTYVVSGLREVISGGDLGVIASSAGALAIFGILAFAGTTLTAIRARGWDSERLKPMLEI